MDSTWGLSRYAYVEGNPIARNDPTGHDWFGSALSVAGAVLDAATGFSSMVNDVQTVFSPSASPLDKVLAVGDLALNVAMDVSMVAGVGEGARAAYVAGKVVAKVAVEVAGKMAAHAVADVAEHAAEDVVAHAAEDVGEKVAESCLLSFSPDTRVATPSGGVAIASLHIGDQVTAYDPATGKTSTQTVQHVWINHDTDLLDVTLQVADTQAVASDAKQRHAAVVAHGLRAPPVGAAEPTDTATHDELIHTTAKHPWLTVDRGFVLAGTLHAGEQVVREDGTPATVVVVAVHPGAADYYNLTVSVLHTYAVGVGQYVVHNCDNELLNLNKQLASESQMAELQQGGGRAIAGRGSDVALHDAPRLVAEYGGEADDWSKITSSAYKFEQDGQRFTLQTHAYYNEVLDIMTEFKSKVVPE